MNSFMTLKIFAITLLVTVLVGPIAQRLLPNWASLVADVGSGGAWFTSIMYHIVYGIIFGAGAALAVSILRQMGKVLTPRGAVIAAALTVLLFDVGFVVFEPKVAQFTYLALFLILLSLVIHSASALIGIGKGSEPED